MQEITKSISGWAFCGQTDEFLRTGRPPGRGLLLPHTCQLPSSTLVLRTSSSSSCTVQFFGRSGCVIGKEWGTQARPRGSVGMGHSTQDDEITTQEDPTVTPPPPQATNKKAAAKAEVEKGQTTAVITGVISVLLGVGYLVLLQVLDTRGVNLVPPPPEAFDP